MNTMLKCRSVRLFCLFLCVSCSLSSVADESVQCPKKLLAPSEKISYDADLKRLFFYKPKMLYAYEAATNQYRWSLPLLQDDVRYQVRFGEASLWEIKTGRRLNRYHFKDEWRIEADVSDDGTTVYVLLSGDRHFFCWQWKLTAIAFIFNTPTGC